MSPKYFVLLIGLTVYTSAEVINEECKDRNRSSTEYETYYNCCDYDSTFNETMSKEEEEAREFCGNEFEKANNVSEDEGPSPASVGQDCYFECVLKKIGAMSEDYKMDKEKVTKWFMEGSHKDFEEVGKQAMEKCYDKTYSKKYCASGVMGLLWCNSEEIVMNCPAKYWDQSEKCTAAKAYMKKCSTNPWRSED
ncbi:hypothetical protein GE061_011737 [Apolygus lucorum]|uniref:Uncharacterized protein n=1 Tax=Apolygus lucorum TaxID=248454 RepID=A0A6A4KB09_APOLU|nr:hypothetical protein GE061_011737 [Apolygus lucorum]